MTRRSSIPLTWSTRTARTSSAAPRERAADGDRALERERGREPAGRHDASARSSAGDPDPGDTHSSRSCRARGSDDNGSFEIVGSAPADERGLRLRGQELVHRFASAPPTSARPRARSCARSRSRSTASTTRRRRSTTARPSAEDSAAGAIDVLANDTDTDGGAKTIASASRAGERHGRAHRRLAGRAHRADLPAGRRTTATRDAGHVHVHAQRRLDRHRVGHRRPASTTRRRRSTTARPWPRTRARARSTCWPTTPTPTADRRRSRRSRSRRTARS